MGNPIEGTAMNQLDDRDYYLRRAACERGMAERATDPAVAVIHLELARRYDILGLHPRSRIDDDGERSGSLAQAAMKVVFIEAGYLDQPLRVEDHDAAPIERHRARQS